MATIEAYSGFSKEINSTKRPSGSGTSISVKLKENTSVLNPHFYVHAYDFSHNYVKWGSRYYFIDDIVSISDGMAEYVCSTDVLATYKDAIGSSTQYVLRSASAYDLNVMDTFYPIESVLSESKSDASNDPGWTRDITSGQFVIGVIGKNASPNGGAVTYYAISPAGMTTLSNYLLDVANFSNVTDVTSDMLKCIFDPMQYIVSCLWFPFSVVASLGSTSIWVGWWEVTGVNATKITDPVYTRNLSFSIPKHPQATRGNYLNMSPYASYVVNAGPWGIIPMNNANLIGETTIGFQITVDCYTGTGRLSMICNDVLAYCEDHVAQIGVPVQLGQNVLNQGAIANLMGGASQAVTGIATGGHGSILGGTIQSIASVMELSQPVSSSIGSNGSIAFNNLFCLVGRFLLIADESLSKNGRPLCAPRVISTLSGYIQVHNADVDMIGTPSEKERAISFLEGGFYYE